MAEELCDMSRLNIEKNSAIKYYVVSRECILNRLKGQCNQNIGKVRPGMLVEALENKNNALTVRLYTKTEENVDDIWLDTEWKCYPIDLISVSPLIWRLLISVSSLEERVRLAKHKKFCKDVENLKPNSKVWYCPDCLDTNEPQTYLAIVKSIGPVSELGDGYYFGLNLPDNPDVGKLSALAIKYSKTFKSPGTFATLSNINPHNTKAQEQIENFEKNFLSNDLLPSNKTDNLFVNRNKDIIDSKKKKDTLQKNKYSLLGDTDNNNQALESNKPTTRINITSLPSNNVPHEQQNDNKKLYNNLKSFDPLNTDDEGEEITKEIDEPSRQTLNYASNYALNHSMAHGLSIGSYVKVLVDNDTHYGVIRWIGLPGESHSNKLMAAIELDDIHPLATDGTYQNFKYFECSPRKAWYTNIENCHQYDMAASSSYFDSPEPRNLEPIQSSIIQGAVLSIPINRDLDKICGKNRGIQGHHNSCYLDATLFSMFAFTSVFDGLLFRPRNEKDCLEYEEVQRVLREEIVNPLRRDLFVGADHVMKLRTLLEKSSSISGLTSEEKDPEEFLTSLVAQTLKAEPFLQLSSGQGAYHYQLFVEKDDKLTLPTVQQLLEQSFSTSNIRLKEVPACFIIQMPRFGKSFKMYPKIQPTLLLDVTDIIDNSRKQCTVCGKLAKFECEKCYGQCGEGLESINFCKECLQKAHCHEKRFNHEPKALIVPLEYETEHYPVSRLYLELLAVVCIETSHYVSFVKCAPGMDSPWCFFDSMADRIGEQDGYNVPEMVPCPDFPYWLSEDGANYLSTLTDDRILPEHAKRLLCDGELLNEPLTITFGEYKQFTDYVKNIKHLLWKTKSTRNIMFWTG